MSISGNISGPGSGWDQSSHLSGADDENSKVDPSSSEASEVSGVSHDVFAEGTSKSISKQEAVVRSSAGAEFLSDTELGMHKVNRALDETRASGKLKLTDSKSKSSRKAFEGSIKKPSSRRSYAPSSPGIMMSGESLQQGETLIPAEIVGSKKVKIVSPEMGVLFLESSGFSRSASASDFSVQTSSTGSSFKTGAARSVEQLVKQFESLSKNISLEFLSDLWTHNTVQGGELSSLETSEPEDDALTVRFLDMEDLTLGSVVLTAPALEVHPTLSSAYAKKSSSSAQLNQEMLIRADESNNQQESIDNLNASLSKIGGESEEEFIKKEEKKLYKELLLKGLPIGGFPLIGGKTVSATWAASSTQLRLPNRGAAALGNVYSVFKDKSGAAGSSDLHQPLVSSSIVKKNIDKPNTGRSGDVRPKDIRVEKSSVSSYLNSSLSEFSSKVSFDSPKERHKTEVAFVLGSTFSFSSGLGMAVFPEEAHAQEKSDLILGSRNKSGKSGPPSHLVYQYRNVSIDPPIILRNPVYISEMRLQVVAKPAVVELRRDNQEHRDGEKEKGKEDDDSKEKDDRDDKKVS